MNNPILIFNVKGKMLTNIKDIKAQKTFITAVK